MEYRILDVPTSRILVWRCDKMFSGCVMMFRDVPSCPRDIPGCLIHAQMIPFQAA